MSFANLSRGSAKAKPSAARTLLAVAILSLCLPLVLLSQPVRGQSLPAPNPQGQESRPNFPSPAVPPETNPSPLTPKQQRQLLKANYEKMKEEAGELATLAKSLQDDLAKSNQDVLSLQIVEKAEKIEKLAKRIKGEAVR